jgi:hypothetical protein
MALTTTSKEVYLTRAGHFLLYLARPFQISEPLPSLSSHSKSKACKFPLNISLLFRLPDSLLQHQDLKMTCAKMLLCPGSFTESKHRLILQQIRPAPQKSSLCF